MENLTQEQKQARDEFFAKIIADGKISQEKLEEIFSDPEKLMIFNALVAATV